MADKVNVSVNGVAVTVGAGHTVAAAILNTGSALFRRSIQGQPRGPVCGMGICYECRATIDGVPHQRTCMITCAEGMEISTDA